MQLLGPKKCPMLEHIFHQEQDHLPWNQTWNRRASFLLQSQSQFRSAFFGQTCPRSANHIQLYLIIWFQPLEFSICDLSRKRLIIYRRWKHVIIITSYGHLETSISEPYHVSRCITHYAPICPHVGWFIIPFLLLKLPSPKKWDWCGTSFFIGWHNWVLNCGNWESIGGQDGEAMGSTPY